MTDPTIPRIDAKALLAGARDVEQVVADAASDVGFLIIENTPFSKARMQTLLSAYHQFFTLPSAQKEAVNIARTGSNRGWGASGAEQVDPDANPDYKQFFDCGLELPAGDPLTALSCYAPNQWPEMPDGFAALLQTYFTDACAFSLDVLCAIVKAIGEDQGYFRDKFGTPMALLRGNYYPTRPAWAGAKDFGIATHTDYGCLTLLATDGSDGLEVRKRGGGWIPVAAAPGAFIINFGEMLEMWTNGRIKATPHRVVGTSAERISIPLFFNPDHDANVAPLGSGRVIDARTHLDARYAETYVHLSTV
ncbi:2-oxoglutarate and iron-dependent oxygenase domain-containing protein [Yoonia sp. SS1-5]|uniref:2-oxoglutarate-dependent ethylene/succinate-forming enzyme n=1 Tax=Yoonia rhodophyticola TaxID=3137370 RepID=A0AAN0MB66_9RHOB